MDSTCSPSTLIIVDVWFHPALPFGGQRRDDGFARGVKLSRSDILSSITLRESGSVGLALWLPCLIETHTHTHKHKHTHTHTQTQALVHSHTQTNTRSIKSRLIKGNSLISVIKEGIIERLLHRDRSWGKLSLCLQTHTHTHTHTHRTMGQCPKERTVFQFVWEVFLCSSVNISLHALLSVLCVWSCLFKLERTRRKQKWTQLSCHEQRALTVTRSYSTAKKCLGWTVEHGSQSVIG